MKRFESTNTDEIVGHIYKTYDYSKFKLDRLNRKLDLDHANKLYQKLLKNALYTLEPIVVSSDYTIVDGQHRFYALRKAKMPIIYFVDNQLAIIDAPVLNSQAKNWKPLDYAQFYAKQGNPNYIELLNVYQIFKHQLTFTTLASLFSKTSWYTNRSSEDLKNGTYELDRNKENANKALVNFAITLKPIFHLRTEQNLSRFWLSPLNAWFMNKNVSKKRLKRIMTFKLFSTFGLNVHQNAFEIGTAYNRGLRSKQVPCYLDSNHRFHFQEAFK